MERNVKATDIIRVIYLLIEIKIKTKDAGVVTSCKVNATVNKVNNVITFAEGTAQNVALCLLNSLEKKEEI